MKQDKLVIANALAVTTVMLWVICTIFIVLLPDFSLTVTSWWMHGLDVSAMGIWNLTFNNFIFGGITWAVAAWGSGYIFGWVWQIASKK